MVQRWSRDIQVMSDRLANILFYWSESRFVPRASPTKQAFPLSDLRVDLIGSDEKILSLKKLSVQSSGHFMCEVILL